MTEVVLRVDTRNEKNEMIATIEKEKAAFEELSSKAMSMGMSISD